MNAAGKLMRVRKKNEKRKKKYIALAWTRTLAYRLVDQKTAFLTPRLSPVVLSKGEIYQVVILPVLTRA